MKEKPRQPGIETIMDLRPDFMPRHPGSGRLKDKVAVITGGDSGIGRAVAVLFAREGAELALCYQEDSEDMRETVRLVSQEGKQALQIAGDLGERRHCEAVVEQIVARFGRVDVLVNNCAEQLLTEKPQDITEAQFERTLRTNLFSYVFMIQACLPHMDEGSTIVNTASVTAYHGAAHLIDYSATKGAIVALTRALSQALTQRGIRVNAVAPGPVWTPLIATTFQVEELENLDKITPMRRPGQPWEIAPSHLFLACLDSSYMTGQVLHPNGGEPVSS